MRLIDADALRQSLGITNMDCDKCAWHDDGAWMGCKRGGDFEDACCAIEDAPTIKPKQQWIPCSERLPEDDTDFLVTDGESMAVGYYRQDVRAWDSADFGWIENRKNGYGINKVIAWMTLPEPYKEGDKNDR